MVLWFGNKIQSHSKGQWKNILFPNRISNSYQQSRILHSIDFSPALHTSVNVVIIGSGKGLAPFRHQAITWTNADLSSTVSDYDHATYTNPLGIQAKSEGQGRLGGCVRVGVKGELTLEGLRLPGRQHHPSSSRRLGRRWREGGHLGDLASWRWRQGSHFWDVSYFDRQFVICENENGTINIEGVGDRHVKICLRVISVSTKKLIIVIPRAPFLNPVVQQQCMALQ